MKLRNILLLAFLAFATPTLAQQAAPAKELPVLAIDHAKAHDSTAVAKTADGATIYRGARGGMYYWAANHKHYLSKAEKARIEGGEAKK